MNSLRARIKVLTKDEIEEKTQAFINVLDTIILLTPQPKELESFKERCPRILTEDEFKMICEIAEKIRIMDKSTDIYKNLINYIGIIKRYEHDNGKIYRLVRTCIKDMKATRGYEWRFNPEKILRIIKSEDRLSRQTKEVKYEFNKKPGKIVQFK